MIIWYDLVYYLPGCHGKGFDTMLFIGRNHSTECQYKEAISISNLHTKIRA
jgi:hypothetical protein